MYMGFITRLELNFIYTTEVTMAINKLTALEVKNAKAADKLYRLSDGGSLYLAVRPNGNKKFEFRYKRPATGKFTFTLLGNYPDFSLADARKMASEYRRMLTLNIDPQYEKQKEKLAKSNTFINIAKKWIDTKEGSLKEKTIHDNWRKLELYAFQSLGGIPITDLTAPIAIDALKKAEKDGKLETVRRTCQLINEIMNYAVNYGYIVANPLIGIREVFKKPAVKHLYALRPEELPELMQAINQAQMFLVTKCLLEWQLHTMVRPGEV